MVLLGLGTTWGCTQWLHREDYTVFDLSDNPDERGSGKMEEASVGRASEEPSQYWLIGFKDRRLEREYLEDLVAVSSSCFLVGSALALLLYLALPLAFQSSAYVFFSGIWNKEITLSILRDTFLPIIVGGLGILAAFIVCCVLLMGKWKVRKDVILYVIEGGYLLYTGALIYFEAAHRERMMALLLLISLSFDCLTDTLLSL